jgi:hypothetical protein
VIARLRLLTIVVAIFAVFGALPGAALVAALPEPVAQPRQLEIPGEERPGLAVVRVFDEGSAPLVGAVVRVLILRDGIVHLAGRAVSDAGGLARIERLPIGAQWFLVDAPGRARASAQRFVGPEPVAIEVRLGAERAFEVEVRDELGRPIAGAEVEISGVDPLPKGVRVGKDGTARPGGIPQGPLKVTARAAGFDPVQIAVAGDARRAKLVLRRLGALVVRVVDHEGRAVEGANVQIAGGGLAVARTTPSDREGRARIAGLAAGSYDLRATKGGLVSPIEIGIALARGGEREVRLVLGAGRVLKIHVVDEGARPIARADVVLAEGGLSPFPFQGMTDARGDVLLGPFSPGPAAAGAQAEGFVPRGPIAVGEEPSLTIALRRAAVLVGDVRDGRGAPIDGATIEVVGIDLDGQPVDARPSSLGFRAALLARGQVGAGRTLLPIGELGVVPGPVPPIPRAGGAAPQLGSAPPGFEPWVTRASGEFRAAPVPPGRLRAIARHPAYVEGVSEVVAVDAGGEGRVRIVLLAGGRLVGRVRDDKGFPVAGAWLEVAARAGSLIRGTRSASDGTYALAAVPGEVTLSLSSPDRPNEVALRVDVQIAEGATKELDLVLPSPRPPSRIRVLDDRRYPVRGAQVTISSLDPQSPVKATGFTDERGEAEIARVAGLRVQLEVKAPKFAVARRIEEALAAELTVELVPGLIVRGTILAPGGRTGVVGATVALLAESGVRRTTTAEGGTFSFADVPRGEATLDARAPGTAGTRKTVELQPTGSRPEVDLGRIELVAAGTIEGTVVDDRGRAVAGARIGKDHAPTFVAAGALPAGVATSDSSGAFTLTDVPVGLVDLEAYAPEVGRGRVEDVRVDAGRTTSRVRIVLRPLTGGTDPGLAPGSLAVTLAELEGRILLAAVASGSEAERAGLLEGDEIVSIDGVAETTIAAARARLSGPLGVDVILVVRRAGTGRTVRVPREATRR